MLNSVFCKALFVSKWLGNLHETTFGLVHFLAKVYHSLIANKLKKHPLLRVFSKTKREPFFEQKHSFLVQNEPFLA